MASNFDNKIKKCDIQKAQIDKFRPFSKIQGQMLKDHFKIGLTYSSNALEGNTLTLIETKVVIEDGLTIGGKTITEIEEATGHGKAYDFIFSLLEKDRILTDDICEIHKIFYSNIDAQNAGVFRKVPVKISGLDSELALPNRIIDLMNELENDFIKLSKNTHPIEFAATIHNKFVTIHPYMDGNGRTARLLMNLILMRGGFTITIIPPIYRSEYIECAYQGNKSNHLPFINMLSCMVYESQKEYLSFLNQG
ncbi:MAG: Fic family protein [Halobacteriovoraceae bacterium]|nr:Fic family protein [Halobacteriovoraceae bacterium]